VAMNVKQLVKEYCNQINSVNFSSRYDYHRLLKTSKTPPNEKNTNKATFKPEGLYMIFLLITQKSHQIETITISFLGYCAI
jgi:hypothetical protein